LPFVSWTIIYWQLNKFFPWGGYPDTMGGAILQLGQYLITGWYHLYFLLVTVQFYIIFPLMAWFLRGNRKWFGVILALSALLQLGVTAIIQYDWGVIPGFGQAVLAYAQVEIINYQFYFLAGASAAIYLGSYLGWVRKNLRTIFIASISMMTFGVSIYFFNLSIGETPSRSSGVFQPAMMAAWLGVVGLLWVVGEYLMKLEGGKVLKWSKIAAELSFGVYLVHMLPLQVLMLPIVQESLGLSTLPPYLITEVTGVLTIVGTVVLVVFLRFTPLSQVLTGRPQYSFAPLQIKSILRSSGMLLTSFRREN
jgi:peptidoglycan/LPS O-acetylase OafA/YrhL